MKRRILAACAALALGLGAVLGTSSAAVASHTPGVPYVALGDSEAAGSGNMPYVDADVDGDGVADCQQSKKAYPTVLSATLGVPVVSAACPGATTAQVAVQALTLHAMGTLGSATQLVTITAGINDIEWQRVLAVCSGGATPECEAAKDEAIAKIPAIGAAIANLVGLVRTLAPNAYIVVTGYPLLFGQVTDTCTIGATAGGPVRLPADFVAEVNLGVLGINQAIAGGVLAYQAAFPADTGVDYVDVVDEFTTHGLCDTADRWIYGVSAGEPNKDRGFHTTAAGQQAWAMAILGELPPL
jgi:lysophospholipase L1-like esterase